MEVKRKLSEFLKRETVLTVAILLAIGSAVRIPPDRDYAGYGADPPGGGTEQPAAAQRPADLGPESVR